MTNFLKTGVAAAVLASSAFAVPALAQSNQGNSVEVRYSDLNLESEEGRERLRERLENAAAQVCGVDQVRTGTRLPNRQAKRCYDEALESFERAIAAQIQQQEERG